MNETEADLRRLQDTLDRSIERAGSFLRSSFQMPEHSLSAEQLTRHLTGVRPIALATVTGGGEPRVAPIGALFVRGAFHVPTLGVAARVGQIVHNPAISAAYYEGFDLAVIAHGAGVLLRPDHPAFAELERLQREHGDESLLDWGTDPLFLRVVADRIFTYARDPSAI